VHIAKNIGLRDQAKAVALGVAPEAAAIAQIVLDFAQKGISFRSPDLIFIQRVLNSLGVTLNRHDFSELLRLGREESHEFTAELMRGHGEILRMWICQDSCTTRNFHETNVVHLGYMLGADGAMVECLVSRECASAGEVPRD
jgi:hypothetical protein